MSELLALALVLALMIGVYAIMFGFTSRGQWLSKRISGYQKHAPLGADILTGLLAATAVSEILDTKDPVSLSAVGGGLAALTWIARKGASQKPIQLLSDLFFGAIGVVAFYGTTADFIWGVDVEQRGLRVILLLLFGAVGGLAWVASFFSGHVNARIGLTLFGVVEVLSYISSPLGTNLFDSRVALVLSLVAAVFLGALAGRGKELVEGVAVVTITVFNALALTLGVNPDTAALTATTSFTVLGTMLVYIVACSILFRMGTSRLT